MKAILFAAVLAAAAAAAFTAPTAKAVDLGQFEQTNTYRTSHGLVRSPHPVGWPCAAFTNQPRVTRRVKQLLIDNGFHRAMSVYVPSKRQIRFHGVQDGEQMVVIVVKTGNQRITLAVDSLYRYPGSTSYSKSFNIGFRA
jgi:hypothetical protein